MASEERGAGRENDVLLHALRGDRRH